MTEHEYDQLMNVVYSRWGAKSYPPPVISRIWFYVRELPAKNFERIIYILLDTQRAAPMPNEFKMLGYAEKDALGIRTAKEAETKPSKEAKCWDCGDSGNLFVRHKRKDFSACMRCHCEQGRKRAPAQGEQWSEIYAQWWEKLPRYTNEGDWRPKPDQSAVAMVNFLRNVPLKSREKRSGNIERAKFGAKPGDDGGAA